MQKMWIKTFCLTLLFTVLVEWPFGPKKIYQNVLRVIPHMYYYELLLKNHKIVYTPIMWTLVEEK